MLHYVHKLAATLSVCSVLPGGGFIRDFSTKLLAVAGNDADESGTSEPKHDFVGHKTKNIS